MFKNVYTNLTRDEIAVRNEFRSMSDELVTSGRNRGYKDAMYIIGGSLVVGGILSDLFDLAVYTYEAKLNHE